MPVSRVVTWWQLARRNPRNLPEAGGLVFPARSVDFQTAGGIIIQRSRVWEARSVWVLSAWERFNTSSLKIVFPSYLSPLVNYGSLFEGGGQVLQKKLETKQDRKTFW
ncbi:unnamed protein product, partial [Ectocarpus fasciculatus]